MVHVGTNNLCCSVWNIDHKQYSDLYLAIRKKYVNAVIVFCAILPRWDSEELYQQSIYYNINLQTLCTRYAKCKYIDICHANHKFVVSAEYFKWDGLHLNNVGRYIFGEELSVHINRCLQPPTKNLCMFMPPELKKLWSRKREKKKKRADENAKPHQNKQSCQPSTTHKAKKSTCHNTLNVPATDEPTPCHTDTPSTTCTPHSCQNHRQQPDPPQSSIKKPVRFKKKRMPKRKSYLRKDGFIVPTKISRPPTPPILPPNRHIPDTHLYNHIPYITLTPHQCHQTIVQDFPRPLSHYVITKLRRRADWRRKQAHRRRRQRKKVIAFPCIFEKCYRKRAKSYFLHF